MPTGNSKDQEITRLQERVSQLEFEASRRDVTDRIRTVIHALSDDDYGPVLEEITKGTSTMTA